MLFIFAVCKIDYSENQGAQKDYINPYFLIKFPCKIFGGYEFFFSFGTDDYTSDLRCVYRSLGFVLPVSQKIKVFFIFPLYSMQNIFFAFSLKQHNVSFF